MTVYVYWYTYVDKVALENSLDIENDNSFVFFLFCFFGYFLFSSLSALQEGLLSFRGTLRCEYCNAEKDVVWS